MKSIKKIFVTTLAAGLASVLSACGGGGSSSATNSTTDSTNTGASTSTVATESTTSPSVSTLTGVNGFKVNYTPNITSPTGHTGQITNPVAYSNVVSIDSFAVADGATPANTYSQTGNTGIRSSTFTTIGQTNLGGTTYTYARFGWLAGSVTETNSSTTTWYTPFALASTRPTSPADITYTGTQQALVYLQSDSGGTFSPVSGYAKCDASANYTATSKTLQLTISNCSTGVGYTISGAVTLSNGTGVSTLSAQQPTGSATKQSVTSVTVNSGNFLLAGPNGEELAGAATVKASLGFANGTGSSNPALFFVVFGGKKQQ